MSATFHVLHANVAGESEATLEYLDIMSDIHINKTGRYQIVRDPKFQMDPTTGAMTVLLEYIDRGVMSEKPVNRY